VLLLLAQIRRYVYCDVVRATDMSPHVDISGIQVCVLGQPQGVGAGPEGYEAQS
jgi:hypothetical protein